MINRLREHNFIMSKAHGSKAGSKKEAHVHKEGRGSDVASVLSSDSGRTPANTHVSRVMAELSMKEQRCRDAFQENALILRRPRNPCNGEVTARDDAPFLIPLEKIMKDNMETEQFIQFERTKLEMAGTLRDQSHALTLPVKPRDVSKLQRVHQLRGELDREIETLKRVAEFKKEQLMRRSPQKEQHST